MALKYSIWLQKKLGHWCILKLLTADGSIRMNSEVYRVMSSAHTQQNASDLKGRMTQYLLQNETKCFSGHINGIFFKSIT